ncbi:hypothetical protein JCM9492_11460 [Aquifex pyrophilus]
MVVALTKEEIEAKRKRLKALSDTYESIQDERIRAQNRLRAMLEGKDEPEENRERFYRIILKPLEEMEKEILKEIQKELRGEPVYEAFLKHVKGVGPSLSAKLLSLPLKLSLNLSSWNAYFGLTPIHYRCRCSRGHKFLYPKLTHFCPICERLGEEPKGVVIDSIRIDQPPRPTSGYLGFWNPYAKRLYYLTSEQFIKLGHRSFYGQMYRKYKEHYSHRAKSRGEEIPRWRLDRRARRAVFKLFLSHFYEAYHEVEGLQPRKPYAFEYLNHSEYVSWKEVVEYELAVKKQKRKGVA